MRQRLRSLRSTATRFVRTLLSVQPERCMLAVEHKVVEALFEQLSGGNGRRDSLANSSVLQLLHMLVDTPQLAPLRTHIARTHRQQLQGLLSAGNLFVKELLAAGSSPSISGEENRPPGSPIKQPPITPPPPLRAAADASGGPLTPRLAAASLS